MFHLENKSYHFRSDFRDRAGNRFPISSVVSHFKFNRVSYLQVFNIAVKLTKMKEETSLAFTTLNESIGMLKHNTITNIRTNRPKNK